ncbi:MAG: MCE family protein [Planctomycetes bacterium]|nr:MCE family protein [Planctomycetota bacterium]MBI3835545.1 MCE family protein [Planctomycetota bacterium]
MSDAKRNFWVGVFVVAALVMFATLLAWFGETPDWLGGNEWTLEITDVPELRGIDPGSTVHLNGVEIGRVRGVDFLDKKHPEGGTVIVARIREDYIIPRGSKALVYGATLGFGTGHIDIIVRSDRPPIPIEKKHAQIRGEMRSVISEIIDKDVVEGMISDFGDMAQAATPVFKNLSRLLEPRSVAEVSAPDAAAKGVTPNFATVVERLDQLVLNLNTVLGDPNIREDLKTAIAQFRTAAENARQTTQFWKDGSKEVADNINGGIGRLNENLDRSFVKLNSILDELDSGAKQLALVLDQTSKGRGTVGLLMNDARLYESALLSLERLSDAIGRLQAILAKIETEGKINVGIGSSGIFKTSVPIPQGEPPPR